MEPKAQPAFPSHGTMGEVVQSGMTMRQYYKAAALTGILAYSESEPGKVPLPMDKWDWGNLADVAGKAADAMLAEDAEHEAQP